MDLVPDKLQKLALVENGLKDEIMGHLFKDLSKNLYGGLSSIVIVKNEVGDQTLSDLVNQFFISIAAMSLKKFVIKNPIQVCRKHEFSLLVSGMLTNVKNLNSLQKLTLSQLSLPFKCISNLASLIRGLPQLEHLDLSATRMNG